MPNNHPTTITRYSLAIPGVPEAQARALDRRIRLHRQMQAFRGPRRVESGNTRAEVTEAALPGPA